MPICILLFCGAIFAQIIFYNLAPLITILVILASLSFLILLMGFFNIRLPFVKARKKLKPSMKDTEVIPPASRTTVRIKTSRFEKEEIPARYSPTERVKLIHLP